MQYLLADAEAILLTSVRFTKSFEAQSTIIIHKTCEMK